MQTRGEAITQTLIPGVEGYSDAGVLGALFQGALPLTYAASTPFSLPFSTSEKLLGRARLTMAIGSEAIKVVVAADLATHMTTNSLLQLPVAAAVIYAGSIPSQIVISPFRRG